MDVTRHLYKPGEGMPGAIYKGSYTPLEKTLLEDLYHTLLPEITMIVSKDLTSKRPHINILGEVELRTKYTYDLIFVFPTGEKRLLNPSLVDVLKLYKEMIHAHPHKR